jgi:midasin
MTRLGILPRDHFGINKLKESNESDIFSIIYNSYSSRLLEKIATCIFFDDPCLLIGDTGCGKTTLTQHFAKLFNKKLHVYNMN